MAAENQDLTESVEELKEKLETMKRLIELEDEENGSRRKNRKCKNSLLTENFMSFTFMAVLLTIIVVAILGFYNLFNAVKKKYPGKNSEL